MHGAFRHSSPGYTVVVVVVVVETPLFFFCPVIFSKKKKLQFEQNTQKMANIQSLRRATIGFCLHK